MSATEFCAEQDLGPAPPARLPEDVSANGMCTSEYHERMKAVPAWWARCQRRGISAGLDWRNCFECPADLPATLAIELDSEEGDVDADAAA